MVLKDKISLTSLSPISIDKDGVNYKRHKKLLFVRGMLLIEISHAMRYFFAQLLVRLISFRLLLTGDHRVFELFLVDTVPNLSIYEHPAWKAFRLTLFDLRYVYGERKLVSKSLLLHNLDMIERYVSSCHYLTINL